MHELRSSSPVLIIGSGIAGATCALTLADQGLEVTLISAGPGIDDGNTALAQGGIVYTGPGDDDRRLEADVLRAGWRHNYPEAVRMAAREGPAAVKDILVDRLKVPFARDSAGNFDLTREGGHSVKRVLHCADYTGRAIMDALMAELAKTPNVRVLTNRTAVDLISVQHHTTSLVYSYQRSDRCLGAYVYNAEADQVETMLARATVLATGGLGRVFLHTTNAPSAIGSALTMAQRAGVRVMNCEIIQFHPTALYSKGQRRFLITEAMRGEGARLLTAAGEHFMPRFDPRGDLAPRDVVSRAILDELLRSGEECVFLDATCVDKDLPTRFPTVYARCLEAGIDITRDPIPVVPAAHYFCGGVLADSAGRTSLDGLYCIGEASCTGLHGANRLASMSLLEGLLWGHAAAMDIGGKRRSQQDFPKKLADSIPDWEHPGRLQSADPALIAQDWAFIRSTMWNYVGIARSGPRLARAYEDLRNLYKRLSEFYRCTPLSKELIDLFHGCHSAYIVATAALRNTKSLGCHYRAG